LNASTGAITGTPTGSGYYIVNFLVTDSASATAQAQITIPINGNQNLGSCTFFPADNVWRQRIDGLPVHAQSAVWNSIYHNATLHPDFGTQYGIPFMTVGAGQALTTVTIDPDNGSPDESDFGINTSGPTAVPIPPDAPIEGTDASSDDRHVLTVDTSACLLYEMFYALLPAWTADSSALFNLNSNALRPAGYTSADAAGLPILPGLVSYDEVAGGAITHALRMTMRNTQNNYLWPARHEAGTSGTQMPPMGARIRLRTSAGVNARIAGLSPTDQVIATALQQYGAFIADNGSSGFFTGVPDARWSDDDLGNVKAHATVTVTLATSADASGGTQLTFASAAGLRAGMWVQCHSACSGIGVAGLTIANPVVTAVAGNTVTLSQPLMADVPQGTVIDFVDPDLACSAGPGFCLDDFDYVDESALQVDPDSGATQPVITQSVLPAGNVGESYQATIAFTGGMPPFTCAVTSGALPAGLTLNPATCAIGGTITQTQTNPFTVTVTDSEARQGQASLTITSNTTNPPPPTIASLSPSSATAGGAAFTLTISGTNFVSGAKAAWGTTALTTTFVSARQLTAAVPASLIATAGTASVTVATPGGTSAGSTFTINPPPPPTIASLSPSSVTAGGAAFTLTVSGTNFVSGATVNWNGSALSTSYGSATQLTASVPASLIATVGTASVTATTTGGTSAGATFTINRPPPTITSLSPNSATAGGAAFKLTVNGTHFVAGATVTWGATALTTTLVSASQLTAAVPASLIATADTASVTVTTTGGVSAGSTFTIKPRAPTIASLNPSSAKAGGAAFTLTISGTGFAAGAIAKWGTTALVTTFVSTTKLTAAVPASLIATAGTASVTVTSAGATSAGFTFTINPSVRPTITSLSPNSATAGGAAFTLTVNGTNFVTGATVGWGSTALTTTFVSATKLTAAVPASLITTAGTVSVTVKTTGGTSIGATFTINPRPTITSLSPSSATVGGPAFTLTVNGTGFLTGATVTFGNAALTTTFVSATKLTAAVPTAYIGAADPVSVVVYNPGRITTNAVSFNVQ
jgi:hypothetical protein